MRLGCLSALALAACASLAEISQAREVETALGPIGEQADQILQTASEAGFSGAAIIEINGQVVLAGGYGWADREARRPFTVDTVAQIGSITKPFTGAAIADLVRRGLLDLDQPISRYLPTAAEPGASVTLRQLLSHRSGMREYCGDDFDRRSRADLLSTCLALPLDLAIDPGDGAAYSNVGYSVLAAIVEEVSGESLEAYLTRRLLEPAGVAEGGYAVTRADPSRLAAGYLQGARSAPISERLAAMNGAFWNLKGNGGMQLSARGMYRWHQALTCRAPMDDTLREFILRPIVKPAGDLEANRGTRVSYGYGWAFRTTANGTPYKLAHGGSDGTFLAYYMWRPYDRVFLYAVANIGEDAARPTFNELRRLIGDNVLPTDAEVAGRPDPWSCH